MTLQDLLSWQILSQIDENKITKPDHQELIRLNYLVMEEAHKVHNNNMMKDF